jgi:hypothetical protein
VRERVGINKRKKELVETFSSSLYITVPSPSHSAAVPFSDKEKNQKGNQSTTLCALITFPNACHSVAVPFSDKEKSQKGNQSTTLCALITFPNACHSVAVPFSDKEKSQKGNQSCKPSIFSSPK